jgi:starch phosphorylase
VREYTENHYLPGAAAFAARAEQHGKLGVEVAAWQRKLAEEWGSVAFGPFKVESSGTCLRFETAVYLGGLDPDAVRVELFADGQNGGESTRVPMERGEGLPNGGFLYAAATGNTRNASDFTARVVPYHPGASAPLEASQILWQR